MPFQDSLMPSFTAKKERFARMIFSEGSSQGVREKKLRRGKCGFFSCRKGNRQGYLVTGSDVINSTA